MNRPTISGIDAIGGGRLMKLPAPTDRQRYVIVVEAKHSDDPRRVVRGLRSLLKRLGRNYGLKAIRCEPIDSQGLDNL